MNYFERKPKTGTEPALDACDFFITTDGAPLSKHINSKDESRLKKYQELRQAVMKNDSTVLSLLIQALQKEADEMVIIVNMAPNGANTLLFLASQFGYDLICQHLIKAKADSRVHPVTKYSPLYIAVHQGHYAVTKLLLAAFPFLINEPTVEKWLPIHAACINGHSNILELLLNYKFPENLYKTYKNGDFEYSLPFNPNFQDVTGQTALYISCILGNESLVNMLLDWKIEFKKCEDNDDNSESTPLNMPSTSRSVSSNLQKIMSSLNLSAMAAKVEESCEKCPISINVLCGAVQETALLAAVRGGYYEIVSILLTHDADPNIIAKPLEDSNDPKCEEIYGICNNCLSEACKQSSLPMVDLLLRHNARCDQTQALGIAISNRCDSIMSLLLARRAHPDPDYKIYKKGLPDPEYKSQHSPTNITYSSMYPTTPVIIEWQNDKKVQLVNISLNWMLNAVLLLNTKLVNMTKNKDIILSAITRIELSHNSLSSVPVELFSLISLRFLNLSQNKIVELPNVDEEYFTAPVLEEIFLQDNQLVSIPSKLFKLPNLTILDISNNKLQCLPCDLWLAPKLRELNVSFNLLKDLPKPTEPVASNKSSRFKRMERQDTVPNKLNFKTKHKKEIIKCNLWYKSLDISDNSYKIDELRKDESVSKLNYLNIANNLFTCIPEVLACLALNLTRLNMSYNILRTMGNVTSYPSTLKHLDLSHNEIGCWPSLPSITELNSNLCYNSDHIEQLSSPTDNTDTHKSFRSEVLRSVCHHRKHLRLESLRTLILSNNILTAIQICTDVECVSGQADAKSKIIFPNLSMLEISNNCLKSVPPSIHELSFLSVLNISGNVHITDLPPELGLLTRLWNINCRGCMLQEPLRTMIFNKKYKTMDIIGYLKSIYEEAQPYTRMKLMVVGIHGIGKSTLLSTLRNKTKTTDHWTKRVSNQSQSHNLGPDISTVGVDIGSWVCENKRRNLKYGSIVFKTWDFGGQKEYYATHQYFLSKRSIYLVLWKITDGEKGVREILQWLGNIQARAPNSSVIIVGTHYDAVGQLLDHRQAAELQKLIRDRFINIPDPEKVGLPRVIDSIEISCKTMHNINVLANIIYDTAYTIRAPGSKEPLLSQKVPSTYIVLEDIINNLAGNLKKSGLDPVLTSEDYQAFVNDEMKLQNKYFRDTAELNQATMFLHDNGVLLHYEDATLRDFYFLDPQWLCDILAHVVTVREINPFAVNGIMKVDDLQFLFKQTLTSNVDNKSYIINLLHKFEVALTWDSKTLLIPSLLPLDESLAVNNIKVKTVHRKPLSNNSFEDFYIENEPIDFNMEIRRLLMMSYFPSGFYSRLIKRILSNDQISEFIKDLYDITLNSSISLDDVKSYVEQECCWKLWQNGLALHFKDQVIFKMSEISNSSIYSNPNIRYKLKSDEFWNDISLQNCSLLEIYFPNQNVVIKDKSNDVIAELKPNVNILSKLLTIAVDHVDLLLEDWYPSLGTRFIHTSDGKFLISRLILCPRCLKRAVYRDVNSPTQPGPPSHSNSSSSNSSNSNPYYDSAYSSRNPSVDKAFVEQPSSIIIYCWMIEDCILTVYNEERLFCPIHFHLNLNQIAPDLMFLDIPKYYNIPKDDVIKQNLLGRGAFGFVFKATCKLPGKSHFETVAMKMLHPVPPGSKATESALIAYKAAIGKYESDPLQHACKAYCTARQELSILLTLKHRNIVSLLGICTRPLSIILELASAGGLDTILKQYKKSGARIGAYTFKSAVLQVAKALEYLHRRKIIYRDLKSENVLVWDFPFPHTVDEFNSKVYIKIADYGISRTTSSNSCKGFGGTEGFMAPEIIRHNGEEQYTEKVDCFSFGMFMYEILTLRQPFEGYETIKECILEGSRPSLTNKECNLIPSHFLDIMVLCWNEDPKKRPSASQIVSIFNAPECIHLLDVIAFNHQEKAVCGYFKENIDTNEDDLSFELWLPGYKNLIDILNVSKHGNAQEYFSINLKNTLKSSVPEVNFTSNFLSCCEVNSNLWIGDSIGTLHVFRISDASHIFSYIFDTTIRSPILQMIYINRLNRVLVGLRNGRIFLVNSDVIPAELACAEGSFVLSEISSGMTLYSMAYLENDKFFDIWCGQKGGNIFTFLLMDCVSEQKTICHYETDQPDHRKVSKLISNGTFFYSVVNPGIFIYQWEVRTKEVFNKLDCSKLLPCSESLNSISIEDHMADFQITALALHMDNLYIGTSWGCLIIAEANTMCPLSVFRPYEHDIKSIIPSKHQRFVATIGRKSRSLIHRFLENAASHTRSHFENHIHVQIWDGLHWDY